MTLKSAIGGIYPVIDAMRMDHLGHDPSDVARVLADLPLTLVQLRCKGEGGTQYRFMARWMEALRSHAPHLRVIVNDRPDLALGLEADGVHVGQDDLPVAVCRRLLGEGRLIGLSTHSLAEVTRAQHSGADYLGFGPIHASTTKNPTISPLGLDGLAEVCLVSRLPVIAIGGIVLEELALVAATGAAGAAMISSLFQENWQERLHQAMASWR